MGPDHARVFIENGASADFTEIGVGIGTNSAGQPYYCQVFGRR